MVVGGRPNIAVARVEVTEGRVVLVNADRAASTHRWLSPRDAGAFTFSVPAEVGFGVEADPNPPRLMGAPFAADLHAGHCYAILPGGQVVLCPFSTLCFVVICAHLVRKTASSREIDFLNTWEDLRAACAARRSLRVLSLLGALSKVCDVR